MQQLKEQIRRGEYVVDPAAVADAIVRRLRGMDTGPEPAAMHSTRFGRPTVLTGAIGPSAEHRTPALAA